ncbi:PepSY-associated TM helix domain-containing protein [Phyllobacterium meliloti]|uniref:PepSY-associated TM helix domain-containing protein n=1 Tax=Phyllobacterium meliloti TaxID=555317 RepID=UPI001D142DE6|nr:PepSY domain-containing protein [Phyllobacterium sp. T1293]UGX85438.1 PepSY domain-containing protein [Phyllobacterium sp. T1293]
MSVSTLASEKPKDISQSLYRAIWRWHFFAGLLVIPFMLNLAITGGLYLFKDEIDNTAFAYRNVVTPKSETLAPSLLIKNAQAAVPDSAILRYRDPSTPTQSARVIVGTDAGKVLVFVDPYTGSVLGKVAEKQEFNWVVRKIHSLVYFGFALDRVVEAVGGLALILVVTGFYLWWPRKQSGGVITVRGTPDKRVFWRDLHAVTGAVAGALIFFLAITGMPWSSYWGDKLNGTLANNGLGYPTQLWNETPMSQIPTKDVLTEAGWTVENAPVPTSTVDGVVKSVGLDQIVTSAKAEGITSGFEVSLPSDPEGVYTAAIFPDDIAKQRTIHFDQYTGKPLVDLKFADYGAGAKAIEFGIGVHMGQYWGLLNQIVMLVTCFAIILAAVSAVIMWWKRRPSGRLGVPPMPSQKSVFAALTLVILSFGVLFPLTGFAILAMLVLDQLIQRIPSPLKRVFS